MSEGTPKRLFVAIVPPAAALEHLGHVVDSLELSRGDGAAARLTAREGWHATLAFLGQVPPTQLPDAMSAVARAAQAFRAAPAPAPAPAHSDAVDGDVAPVGGGESAGAGQSVGGGSSVDGSSVDGGGVVGGGGRGSAVDDDAGPGLRLRLVGGGAFGDGERQILWVGFGGDLAGLRRLADAVRRELADAGLTTDAREFRAHLTISRPRVPIHPELIASALRQLRDYAGPLWTAGAIDLVASERVPTDAGPRSRYTTLTSAPL
jgi:2'-5' RNA ligase